MPGEASGEQFVTLLEAKQLLPAKMIESLRGQLAGAKKPIAATAIAKLLVDKGHLTPFQAKQLLSEAASPDIDLGLSPAASTDDDDLGLAPLEDEKKHKKKSTPAASKAADDDLGLANDLGLAPAASEKKKKAPGPEPAETSLFDEELGGLEDDSLSAGGGLDDLLDDPLMADDALASSGSPLMPAKKKGRFGGRAAKKRKPGQSQYDTPLMLVGGGALVLLLLVGGVLLFFYTRGGGDQLLQAAEQDYNDGALQQAIHKYNEFLEDHSGHPQASHARVRLWMARLRQSAVGGGDSAQALELAKQALAEIVGEEKFIEARAELGALLPQIAEGLSEQARSAATPDEARQLVAQTEEALVLASNTKYVPLELRDETRLEKIRGSLALVSRDLGRDADLQAAIAAIDEAIAAGETQAAYDARRNLIKTYPDLEQNAALAAAAAKIAEAERKSIRVVDEPIAAETEPRPSPVVAELALAVRQGGAAEAEGAAREAAFVRVDGAVYGIESASGKLLWRRFTGFDSSAHPQSVESDALLTGVQHWELQRVAGKTGDLVWRLPIGESFANPLVDGASGWIATRSGDLWQVDLATGASPRRARLPLPAPVSPALDARSQTLYVVGEHSNLYCLASTDLSAKGVFYLGHQTGTVRVPPTVLLKNLIVADNWGATDSTLRVLSLADDGTPTAIAQTIRLQGHVVSPPIVFGRRMVVATDRGLVKVFEVTAAEGDPLVQVAERVATAGEPLVRHLMVENDRLWIADDQLARFAIQSSTGRLVSQPIPNPEKGDVFDAPLVANGGLLIHLRRPASGAGAWVAAVDMSTGERRWQTLLATPPAGPAIVDAERRTIASIASSGAVFQLDAGAIRARVQDQPLAAPPDNPQPPLVGQVALGENRFAIAAAPGSQGLYVFDDGAGELRKLRLTDPLACSPVAVDGAIVAPARRGQVRLIDPATGKDRAAPFQPRLEPGASVAWTSPGVAADGSQLVISDGAYKLYRLGVASEPAPHLAELAASEPLSEVVISPVAVVGETAAAVNAVGKVVIFSLEKLEVAGEIDLGGQAVWGPYTVGQHALLVTDRDELLAIDAAGEEAWRVPLEHPGLAGMPLLVGEDYLFASKHGAVWRVKADSGQTSSAIEVGQPLAAGPALFGPRLVLSAADGTLLVVEPPGSE
jgi:outer membrane protein assembly factor BamB